MARGLGVPLFAGRRCFFDARSELGLDHIRRGWIYTSTFVARKNRSSPIAIFISPMGWGKRIKSLSLRICLKCYPFVNRNFTDHASYTSRACCDPGSTEAGPPFVNTWNPRRQRHLHRIMSCGYKSLLHTTKRKMWYWTATARFPCSYCFHDDVDVRTHLPR
jgi:hypothetical protein